MAYRKRLGDEGEKAAFEYIEKNGLEVIEKNYRCRFGEVDIIAKDGEYIAFIEVKTRTTDFFGMPCEAVNIKKQRSIIKSGLAYMRANHLKEAFIRLDIIEILGDIVNENLRVRSINHIKNAFEMR